MILSVDIRYLAGTRPIHATFELPSGITALFGASGAGKSTLLHHLAGLRTPEAGTIKLDDDVLFDHARRVDRPPQARRIGLVFQSLALFPHLTAIENVAYGIERGDRAAAMQWLERTKVANVAAQRPATLSGGEAQRVALARALAHRPSVLLLDEPLTALDPPLRRALASDLKALLDELAIPTLLVSHDFAEAARFTDRALAILDGKTTEASHIDTFRERFA